MAVTINGTTGIDTVQDGVISTAKLVDGAVTSAKIGNGEVSSADLASSVLPLGVGQTLQDVTGSRALGTTYTNSTGRLIFVIISASQNSSGIGHQVYIDGGISYNAHQDNSSSSAGASQFIVPNGSTYRVAAQTGVVLNNWLELR